MRCDAELVEAVLAGQREAFADLVRRYEHAVRAAILAVLRDYHFSQDVAQDTFVTAYERLGSLRHGSAFGAWLLQIARRKAVDAAQRRPRTEPLQAAGLMSSVGQDGQLDEASHRLLSAVMRLPERERMMVILHYFADQKVADIAEATGRPVGTVTGSLARARDRLRRWLKESEP